MRQHKNIKINESTLMKLERLYKRSLNGLSSICNYAGLDKAETNLVKRHVKGYLLFEKRGSVLDLPTISKLASNRAFSGEMNAAGVDFLFFMWLVWDFASIGSFYTRFEMTEFLGREQFQALHQLDNENTVMSYSGLSMLYAHLAKKKPEDFSPYEYTKDIEISGETRTISGNTAENFFNHIKIMSEENKVRAIGGDFYDFARIVLSYFPEEKENLFSISGLPFDDKLRDRIIYDAERYVMRQRHNLAINEVLEEAYNKKSKVPVPLDLILASRKANPVLIQGDLIDLKRAIWEVNNSGKYKLPITEKSYTIVQDMLSILAGDASGLTPIKTGGHKFKVSIYKLWKIATGGKYEPSNKEINAFIMGLEFARNPIVCPHYYDHPKKGKIPVLISISLAHIGAMLLPDSEDQGGLSSQEITIEPSLLFTGGEVGKDKIFSIDDVDNADELGIIEAEEKEFRLLDVSALENSSPQWRTFRSILVSCTHMKESDLMEKVFDYSGTIEEAKGKDEAGEKYTGKGKHKDIESYTKRYIVQNKGKDRQTLISLFERAKELGIIIKYKLKPTGVYEWSIKRKEKTQ